MTVVDSKSGCPGVSVQGTGTRLRNEGFVRAHLPHHQRMMVDWG